MNRSEYVLAVLSLLGQDACFSPVQVQKLFFLLDREIPELTAGPRFAFTPYDYGPFDSAVYHELEALSGNGLVAIQSGSTHRLYRLTESGREKGSSLSVELDAPAQAYIKKAGAFVLKLSFKGLVTAIYNSYPDTKAASIFRG
jgi:uncharacterized protein